MSLDQTLEVATTAEDLLSFDGDQLFRYLESNRQVDGSIVLSNVHGIETLSKVRRDELGRRLTDAASQAEHTKSQPVDTDDLIARLTNLERGPEGSPKIEVERRSPSPDTTESLRSTQPDTRSTSHYYDCQSARYHELVQNSGRPICSLDTFLSFLSNPRPSYSPLIPWIRDPDTAKQNGEVETLFSRQLSRWWDFRKWQNDNRGRGDDVENGFPEFLESERRMYTRISGRKMPASRHFEESSLRRWQSRLKYLLVPNSEDFSTYSDEVLRRLAHNNFSRSPQLMKDPRKQDEWTTWLEYLVYEQWWLDLHTNVANCEDGRHFRAWKRFLDAAKSLPGGPLALPGVKHDVAITAVSGQRTSRSILMKQLTTAHASLETTKKLIDDFIQQTAHYRQLQANVDYKKDRVKWILDQARAMEAETPQQPEQARNTSITSKGEGKKKARDSDEASDPGSSLQPSKRVKIETKAQSKSLLSKGDSRKTARAAADATSAQSSVQTSKPVRVGLKVQKQVLPAKEESKKRARAADDATEVDPPVQKAKRTRSNAKSSTTPDPNLQLRRSKRIQAEVASKARS